MESPPKRVTRARAAAKAGSEPAVRTTRIVTAAAQAKSSKPVAAKNPITSKRKTRSDEDEDETEEEQRPDEATAVKKPTRGRPRKAPAPETTARAPSEAPATRTTRGRAAKKPSTEATKQESAPVAKATRGRPKKVVEPEPKPEPGFDDSEPEMVSRTARGRSAAAATAKTSSTAAATTATKSAPKKSVKFQEPGQENVEPVSKAKAKEPSAGGMRGRAVRRGGAATAARSTRKAAPQAGAAGVKKPLSPRKVTQMPMSRDEDSEDELAGEYTPVKPMMKSPVKPRAGALQQSKRPAQVAEDEDADSTINVNDAILNPPDLTSTSLMSPARRAPASVLKDSLKSPARKIGSVPLPGSAMKPAGAPGQTSPFKTSLLQSAAKRPPSPIKSLQPAPSQTSQAGQSAMKASLLQSPAKRSVPGFRSIPGALDDNHFVGIVASPTKPSVSATPTASSAKRPSEKLLMDVQPEDSDDGDLLFSKPIEKVRFPGRLSAVLPREADPALDESSEDVGEDQDDMQLPETVDEHIEEIPLEMAEGEAEEPDTRPEIEVVGEEPEEFDDSGEPMALDTTEIDREINTNVDGIEEASEPPAQPEDPMYQLREKDQRMFADDDSEAENELTSVSIQSVATPAFARAAKSSRRSTLGFTALSEQLGSWSTTSHSNAIASAEDEEHQADEADEANGPSAEETPAASHFFEEEMSISHDVTEQDQAATPGKQTTPETQEPIFDDVLLTEEDFALAQEANEMSLMEPAAANGESQMQAHDDSLSDASQEYGDENQMPIDPALMGNGAQVAPETPVRPKPAMSFNTTTKVPLKPADNSTPSPLKKRSFSASRVAPRRPTNALSRNATVISYSPSKNRRKSTVAAASTPSTPAPVTPSKADMWSNMGTPARTPARDLNPHLLQGAVVFVDVHTSEGADASSIFVELLSQMGARCLKTWNWNPSTPSDSANKVGITHVVYKDGGKRTLEKVRETNGIVHCVGVSWVLDCERENKWLEETPYYIDTSFVPRGGARRRKSMEPKALANMNGTLVDSTSKAGGARDVQFAANSTPMNRRQSTVWMHTPPDQTEGDLPEDDIEWSQFLLTPVPKTPAPEAIARYAEEVPETPTCGNVYDEMESLAEQSLLMRTCPPKCHDLGVSFLDKEKDENVMMRLMAARRKSMQFAPKIGSPLARTWK